MTAPGARAALGIDPITQQFIERTLPKSQWTHQTHLRVGLWHLLSFGEARALLLMRERIRSYNESTGVVNSDQSGYHETITRFYLRAIRALVDSLEDADSFEQLAGALCERHGERDEPLRYYSRDKLFSTEARRAWIEPDLAPLPQHW
jgi:hypothetical protein